MSKLSWLEKLLVTARRALTAVEVLRTEVSHIDDKIDAIGLAVKEFKDEYGKRLDAVERRLSDVEAKGGLHDRSAEDIHRLRARLAELEGLTHSVLQGAAIEAMRTSEIPDGATSGRAVHVPKVMIESRDARSAPTRTGPHPSRGD